jgi:hypothetical protein
MVNAAGTHPAGVCQYGSFMCDAHDACPAAGASNLMVCMYALREQHSACCMNHAADSAHAHAGVLPDPHVAAAKRQSRLHHSGTCQISDAMLQYLAPQLPQLCIHVGLPMCHWPPT